MNEVSTSKNHLTIVQDFFLVFCLINSFSRTLKAIVIANYHAANNHFWKKRVQTVSIRLVLIAVKMHECYLFWNPHGMRENSLLDNGIRKRTLDEFLWNAIIEISHLVRIKLTGEWNP